MTTTELDRLKAELAELEDAATRDPIAEKKAQIAAAEQREQERRVQVEQLTTAYTEACQRYEQRVAGLTPLTVKLVQKIEFARDDYAEILTTAKRLERLGGSAPARTRPHEWIIDKAARDAKRDLVAALSGRV